MAFLRARVGGTLAGRWLCSIGRRTFAFVSFLHPLLSAEPLTTVWAIRIQGVSMLPTGVQYFDLAALERFQIRALGSWATSVLFTLTFKFQSLAPFGLASILNIRMDLQRRPPGEDLPADGTLKHSGPFLFFSDFESPLGGLHCRVFT